MKREEKNTLSKRRIQEAALREFSQKGYDAASLNTICSDNDISKGIIYHYFEDKDALYLICVKECFDHLTSRLQEERGRAGTVEQKLQGYFDARIRFFAEEPLYLGVFLNAVLYPPTHLLERLLDARKMFDQMNMETLTELLMSAPLRQGLAVATVVEDFKMYMDYFNTRFQTTLANADTAEQALKEHEAMCHRQLGMLLYGVIGEER